MNGPTPQLLPFDLTGAILAYVAARGSAPEDDILKVAEARAEEHSEDTDAGSAVEHLFELVTDGRLRWRLPRGGDPMSTPLIYSLSAQEKRARKASSS